MEPSSGSVAGVTFTIGTVSVVGTLLGMHYDALLFGLFGGLIFLTNNPSTTRTNAIGNVIASVLIAGSLSPVLGALLVSWFEVLTNVGEDNMRRASSLIIGAGWQASIPTAMEILRSKAGIQGRDQ